MLSLIKPHTLMVHSCDHYIASFSKSAGASVATYTLTTENIPCLIQPQISAQDLTKRRVEEVEGHICYLLDKTAYDVISAKDRIVFSGDNYQVTGKQDLISQGAVFLITLQIEAS